MSENKKPAIRFKGFTEDWKQRKLGEVAQYRNGKAHENCIDENGKYIVVNSKFVSTDGGVKKFSNMQNEALFENELAFVLSDVPNGRAIARTFLVEESDKYTLNQRIAGITPLNEIYSYFLYILMNRHPYFLAFDDGAKQTNLSVSDVMGFEAYYPKYNEQKKIGDYFHHLDDLITLHQRKLDKMINVKKSMLEKMFPKNDSNIPEIRFKGFTKAWEQSKLGELGSLKNGMNFSKEAMGVGFSFVNLQNIFGHNFIDVENLGKAMATSAQLKDYNLRKGDVLFVRSSVKLEGVGEAALVPESLENTTYSGFIIRFRDEAELDDNFKRFVFRTVPVRKQIMSQATDSANKNVSQSVLDNLKITIPSKREQAKIGKCFSNLDNLITLHQRKLEKLQNIKKSMLEKMFV
ncbi:MAG: restriction endonuclease subunit S [Dorea sp.]|nr:restriction endonuclease subunit S [Dorea sp.]